MIRAADKPVEGLKVQCALLHHRFCTVGLYINIYEVCTKQYQPFFTTDLGELNRHELGIFLIWHREHMLEVWLLASFTP
jgi:hypothetical protein